MRSRGFEGLEGRGEKGSEGARREGGKGGELHEDAYERKSVATIF